MPHNHHTPIVWAEKGVRKEDHVRRWLRRMAKNNAYGVFFHLQEHGAGVDPQRLSEVTGQPVVVENKPGAGTALGAEIVAKSDPDGYTLLNVTNATLAAIPHLVALTYDAETAFVPLAVTGDSYSYLAVNPEVPAQNLPEFIDYAKKNPGKLN